MHNAMGPIVERMKSAKPMRWVFTGDSITHGALHTWGARDYTEHFSERLRYELDRKRNIVIKTGISGWTTGAILDDIEWNVLQFRPHVVSIMIGMNDAVGGPQGVSGFRENYLRIIERVLAAPGTAMILHTTNPIWAEAASRQALPLYVEEIRRIARERSLPVVDHWAYWTKAWEEKPIRRTTWMNDEIHPGAYGHVAFAHLLLRELGLWDDASNVCRLMLP